MSLFGVEAVDPSPADLAGLLAGPGTLTRMGGTARVSATVVGAWRVHVLAAELAVRGVEVGWEPMDEYQFTVRTAFSSLLAPLAATWLRGGQKRPPASFHLSGPRLRLWMAAAGTLGPTGCVLALHPADDEICWEAVGAALSRAGLPAALLDVRAGGPAYRITGRRRLARLAESIGQRPAAAPPEAWPLP
jgi:hypothetical protein